MKWKQVPLQWGLARKAIDNLSRIREAGSNYWSVLRRGEAYTVLRKNETSESYLFDRRNQKKEGKLFLHPRTF